MIASIQCRTLRRKSTHKRFRSIHIDLFFRLAVGRKNHPVQHKSIKSSNLQPSKTLMPTKRDQSNPMVLKISTSAKQSLGQAGPGNLGRSLGILWVTLLLVLALGFAVFADRVVQHTVKSGESVTSIARKYGVSNSQILSENNIANADSLAGGPKTIHHPAGRRPGPHGNASTRFDSHSPGQSRESDCHTDRRARWTGPTHQSRNCRPGTHINTPTRFRGLQLWQPGQ